MEQEIIVENLKKYHQTEKSCHLFDPPLYQEIGPLGDGPAQERILDGTYTAPEAVLQATTDFLMHMSKSSSVSDLTIEDCLMSKEEV